jgi:flagellar biogenesis protein FliO
MKTFITIVILFISTAKPGWSKKNIKFKEKHKYQNTLSLPDSHDNSKSNTEPPTKVIEEKSNVLPEEESLPENIASLWSKADKNPVKRDENVFDFKKIIWLSSLLMSFIFIFVGILWWFQKKTIFTVNPHSESYLKCIQSMSVGYQQRLLLVDLNGERILLAQNNQGIQLLHHFLDTQVSEQQTTLPPPNKINFPKNKEQNFNDIQGLLRLKAQDQGKNVSL